MNDKQDAARRLGETIEIEGEVRVGNSDVPTPVARVTPADLARWRAAADAATEGPWDADVIPHDPEEPCVPEYANLEPNIGAGLTVADAGFIALARIAMPRLLDEVERLRETVTRLNRRAQIAESAINDLTREPIGGREHAPVAAEVWARCEETHGLVCRAAREARAELGLMRAGIEALAAEMQADTCPSCHVSYADEGSTTWGCDHTEGMQHAGDMLRALLAEGGE